MESQDELIEKAVTRLNKKNLLDLWLTHSALSVVDYFGGDYAATNPFSPILTYKNLSLFGEGILRSSAGMQTSGRFTSRDAPLVFNALSKAEDTGAVEFLRTGSPADVEARLLRYISFISYSQFRFQAGDVGRRIARSYAFLEALPTGHKRRLRTRHGQRYFSIPEAFQNRFGLSLKEYYQCISRLFSHYERAFVQTGISEYLKRLQYFYSQNTSKGRNIYMAQLLSFIDNVKQTYGVFALRPHALLRGKYDPMIIDTIQAFLALSARDTGTLRDHRKDSYANRVGLFGHRLSPLEMFPIVSVEIRNESRYIVPNLRYLDLAAPQIPHYALMRAYPQNEYNEQLGTIQELYLEDLVRTRMPQLSIIPEIAYGKPEIHGPDLTLIEEDRALIVVESKAKRMRIPTKVDPMSDELLSDLHSGLEALEKLPRKINDMYANLPEYSNYQGQIDSTKMSDKICIIVYGDGVYSMANVVQWLLDNDPEHFLHTFSYPYCIMSVDTFERAIEVAASNDLSLSDLLLKYWETSLDRSPKPHPPAEFGGLRVDPEQHYLRQYSQLITDN